MFEYKYSRKWLEAKNHFDIGYNNPDLDPPIVEPLLNDEIFTAIGKKSIVRCDSTTCSISFDVELTTEEKTSLDGVVATHKANANE